MYYRNVIQVCHVSSLIIISIGIYTPYRHALTVAITWHCACTQVMVYIREVLTFVFRSWMREIGFMFFLKVWYLCVTHYNHCMYCIPGDFAKPSYIPLHHRNSRWDEILPLQKRSLWDFRDKSVYKSRWQNWQNFRLEIGVHTIINIAVSIYLGKVNMTEGPLRLKWG